MLVTATKIQGHYISGHGVEIEDNENWAIFRLYTVDNPPVEIRGTPTELRKLAQFMTETLRRERGNNEAN